MQRIFTCFVIAICLTIFQAAPAEAWEFTGGAPWQNRVGPGIMLGMGGNSCTGETCDDFDIEFGGSFGATVGFFYRVIPNLSLFADVHFGYLNSDIDLLDDDSGFLFQGIAGAELHIPLTDWLDTYLGLGLGYAYLAGNGESGSADGHLDLKGFDFELRFGTDVYPFSRVPTLGAGLLFRFGMPVWLEACQEIDTPFGDSSRCDDPDEFAWFDDDEPPFLVHFGMALKYGF